MSLLKPALFQKGQFQNPIPTEVGGFSNIPRILRAMYREKAERVPLLPLGPFHTDSDLYLQPPASGLRITWLGHSSLLVEIDGTTILIDPIYAQRASFVQWFGPKRFFPPPLPMGDLPQLDAVLLSHDHYDHLDGTAMLDLADRTPVFITSLGVDGHLKRWGVPGQQVRTMNWTDTLTVGNVKITALPTRHFSGRGLKRNTTLWSSFMLEGPKHRVYFGADSGPWPGFKEIGEHFGPIDLAMLEIGAWYPLWGSIHLGPDCAADAFRDLGAKQMMPIHWALFSLALHAWHQPADRIVERAAQDGITLFMPEPGQPTEVTGEHLNTLWWKRYLSR